MYMMMMVFDQMDELFAFCYCYCRSLALIDLAQSQNIDKDDTTRVNESPMDAVADDGDDEQID